MKTFQVEEKKGSVRRKPATRIRTSPQIRRTRLESRVQLGKALPDS